MKHVEAYDAIKETVKAVYQKLGDRYHACYLYGSLVQGFYQVNTSDVNLLFVVAEDTSIHELREAFLPIWRTYERILGRPPAVATPRTFRRYLILNPLMAHHLTQHGKKVRGGQYQLPHLPPPTERQRVAYLATELMNASRILMPDLLSDTKRQDAQSLLNRLARRLNLNKTITTPEAQFQLLQQYLQKQLATLEGTAVPLATVSEAPPFEIPALQSVYIKMDQLLLVVRDVADLKGFNWSPFVNEWQNLYGGIQIVTPAQLKLAVEEQFALEYVLRNFRPQWGDDFLADLPIPDVRTLRDAALFNAHIQIFDMPQLYLKAEDETTERKIIHDVQNKLLNTRLQNELLFRFGLAEKNQPGKPLPDRNTPTLERIDAIFEHLEWWTQFYTNAMLTAEA